MSLASDDAQKDQGNSVYAAFARTTSRALALYFSRPVRLFRPSKVSGWALLHGLASSSGTSLSPQFLSNLIKQHGVYVVGRHFVPPIIVNAGLGVVLWSSYSEAASYLQTTLPSHPTLVSALAGAIAGGSQALIAAPAENVRLAIERSTHTGWASAWKSVFIDTQASQTLSKPQQLREARQVVNWMKEVTGMAGRGWDGWKWGMAKDMCGFALFFSIFDITRRSAAVIQNVTETVVDHMDLAQDTNHIKQTTRRITHAVWLVTGGVLAGLAYEYSGRPWDTARKLLHNHELVANSSQRLSSVRILSDKVKEDGIYSFFRKPQGGNSVDQAKRLSKLSVTLRTLARVGPWGVGFLVWEAFGPGLVV